MDENGPPIPPNDFLLPSERTSAESSVAHYRDEAEVRDGFLIALRAMGLADAEQHSEPVTLPVGSAKP